MIKITNNDWDIVLEKEYYKDYFQKLLFFLKNEYKTKTIYPKYDDIFNALIYTPYKKVRVVIIGQDPYHGENQSHGLSFSVPSDQKRPPSLRNIFLELEKDLNIKRNNNNLSDWARQGVLLLNSIMTVEKSKPLSHKKIGWETFTDEIIKKISNKNEPVIFVLWGNYAKSKKILINAEKHIIIESTHPSPLSATRGFFNSQPFSKINKHLNQNGYEMIKW